MNRLTSVRSKSMWLASVFMVVFLLFGWMATGLAQENIVDIDALTQAFRDVKRVRVVVGQTYGEADEVSLPFHEYAEKILNYAGLSVVEEDATTYDATISIEAKGIPGSASYMGTMGGSHWTKATVEGKISFSAGDKIFRWDFSYAEGPYGTIHSSFPTPNDAPFQAAFNRGFIPAFFKAIAKVLGMPPLISALKDEDGNVRRAAVEALGEFKDPRAVEPLISALEDEDWHIRLAAEAALEEINPKWRETEEAKRKVPEFISALKDKDGNVRYRAAEALGELKDPRAVEPLISALKDENGSVRSAAVWVLGELKDPRAVEPLISALKDENWSVRRAAAVALGELKDPRAVETLISALKDEFGSVREAAAVALGELKDPRVVETLISALKDEFGSVREAAAGALNKITGEDFGEDEAKWRDWLGEE